MIDRRTEGTRIGIEFLTLWLEPDRQAAAARIMQVLDKADEPTRIAITAGLLNLSMFLAFELAKASGAKPEEYVDLTRAYLQRLAPDLPF